MSYTIIGVTGHIDHGKTSLVLALTGRDCDTHPEEKRRGITIDLGFAAFQIDEHEFALIDAPGHQRYVGNLLAGVSRVDVGLLLVAADQGIQAQTIEHAAILKSLGVQRLICVVSRCDLATTDACDDVQAELELFLGEVGFDEFPCVRVSTKTGLGLEQLRGELVAAASDCEQAASKGDQDSSQLPFRMPIDRAFHVPGRGQIAAGTIWTGGVQVGDLLELSPGGQSVRVREIEQHGTLVDKSQPGRRTALNLVGDFPEICRGDELLATEKFVGTKKFLAQVQSFTDASELRLPAEAQLHTATTACDVRISGPKRLERGQTQWVVLEARMPVVATYGQMILLRRPYPVGSLAGGIILADLEALERHQFPHVARLSRRAAKHAIRVSRVDFAKRLSECSHSNIDLLIAWSDVLGELDPEANWLTDQLGISADQMTKVVDQLRQTAERSAISGRIVTNSLVGQVQAWQLDFLQRQQARTEQPWVSHAAVIQACDGFCSPETATHCLRELAKLGEVSLVGKLVAIASAETKLSKKQTALFAKLLAAIEASEAPPTLKELSEALATTQEQLGALARFGVLQNRLVDCGGGMMFSQAAFVSLVGKLLVLLNENGSATVAEIRDVLQLTRKHVIPLLEHCDAEQITQRDGNQRSGGPNASQYLGLSP